MGHDRGRTDIFSSFSKFVKDVERVAALAVKFVDKDDYRRLTHAAHLHQTAGLRLHALGHIDYDYYRVNGCEGTERVLGEVLVARRVEDIDFIIAVIEAHH